MGYISRPTRARAAGGHQNLKRTIYTSQCLIYDFDPYLYMLSRHVNYREKNMSEHIYEARQLSLWDEYKTLKGTLTFDAFLERHVKVNAYVVSLMRKEGVLPDYIDRSESAKRFAEMDLVQMGE